MLGPVAGREPPLVAALSVWASRMVLAVIDILEEAADADPASFGCDNRGRSELIAEIAVIGCADLSLKLVSVF